MIDDREFLDHIRIAATRVLEYTREGRAAFEADTLTQENAIRAKLEATPQNTSQDNPDSTDAKPT